jgi:GNAT superfamily N-acetyltransferase
MDDSIKIAVEKFDDSLIAESRALMERHWEELAYDKDDVPLDPDYDFYKRSNEAGYFVVYTVRNDSRLAGYAAYYVMPHKHYSKTLFGVSDLLFVEPELRNAGVGEAFVDFIENDLRKRNAKIMHTTTKVSHPALGRLLVHRGHQRIEAGYRMRLS